MKQLLKKLVRKANEKANPEEYLSPISIFFYEPKKRDVKTVYSSMSVPIWIHAEHEEVVKNALLRELVPHIKEVAIFKTENEPTNFRKRITASVDVLEKKEADL